MKDLSLNEHHYPPAPNVLAAVRECDVRYYAPSHTLRNGLEPLQEKIGDKFGVDPSWVRLTAGAEEGLVEIIHAQRVGWMHSPVLLPEKTWPVYYPHIKDAGLFAYHFEMEDTWSYDPDKIQEAIDLTKPSLVLLCSPNNPTSHVICRSDLEELLENKADFAVDETYWGFSSQQENYGTLLRDHQNLMLIRSFSKFYGLAGARIGYMIVHPDTQKRFGLSNKKMGLNVFSERLATAALESHDYYADCAKKIMNDRDAIINAINLRWKCGAPPSETNFVFFRQTHEVSSKIRRRFEEEGYKIQIFENGPFNGHVRFGIGTQADTQKILKIIWER
jgi:histidinol-phosphate aminotransferase